MASSLDFVEYIVEQISGVGVINYKKMFGEYMIYCNAKPVVLVCDDTAFVKILPETTAILGSEKHQGYPYKSAKLHYIVDVDDKQQMNDVVRTLERIIPLPKKKK